MLVLAQHRRPNLLRQSASGLFTLLIFSSFVTLYLSCIIDFSFF